MTANGRIIVAAAGPNMLPLLKDYAPPTFDRLARALDGDLRSVDLATDSSEYLAEEARRARPAKMDAIEQAFSDGYEEVLWLDADTLVGRCDDHPFRYLRADDFQGFMLEHNSIEARTNPNTGVWLIRKTPMARNFISDVRMTGELAGSNWSDQAAVVQALGWRRRRRQPLRCPAGPRQRIPPAHCRYSRSLEPALCRHGDPSRNCPVVPHPYVVHFAGMVVLAEREAAMRECYEAWVRDVGSA